VVGESHFSVYPAVAQLQSSQALSFISVSEFDCFCALWIGTVLQPFNQFYASEKAIITLQATINISIVGGYGLISLAKGRKQEWLL
jgi:hypothetical protein